MHKSINGGQMVGHEHSRALQGALHLHPEAGDEEEEPSPDPAAEIHGKVLVGHAKLSEERMEGHEWHQ
eukprot:CAMPEP_0114626590 /NCGR_PEP_ID=MMETSP0168-20121206/11860_1 /TAXON_ID=95228 ORGANISM="Vannella sp., Strain DIVA3 517/6/12" /NCGR_SAMPLE_ID=MMETSP0168 /ASSEMBLY_ACC=CAM_ASM_000044 /LENGTH=67 /DNA_ID=CAMNT_0001837899 /DNA_START=525 /DNA_END=728 /DNA_ORIENTATION=+